MSDEQHMAMPRLYGGPAYSRPPRPAEVIARPFDPDELPLEAERSEEDIRLADQLLGGTWAATSALPAKPKGRGGRAAKAAKGAAKATAKGTAKAGKDGSLVGAGVSDPAPAGLQGRPFSLRSLGRIFSGDRR